MGSPIPDGDDVKNTNTNPKIASLASICVSESGNLPQQNLVGPRALARVDRTGDARRNSLSHVVLTTQTSESVACAALFYSALLSDYSAASQNISSGCPNFFTFTHLRFLVAPLFLRSLLFFSGDGYLFDC